MAKTVKGMQETFKISGKNMAIKYCQDWKKELDNEGKTLQDKLKRGELDMRAYNQKRIELNKQLTELNGCVIALNKA